MNTTENNRLIAEFVQKGSQGFGTYDFDGCLIPLNQVEFHTNWNQLMEVVNKITKIDLDTSYKYFDIHSFMYANIEEVYNACVEFIKFYNNQKL